MIDPKLLTPEFGFEDGVVVEFGTIDGFTVYGKISGRTETCFYFKDYYMPMYAFENIQFIRPLTGPMSIWLHAPEWANYLWKMDDSLLWYKGNFVTGSNGCVSKRPWWASDKG